MAVFGGCGGTAATTAVFFKVSKNLCQENTFLFSYLYSEIKTKPNNHGLHESGNPPPLNNDLILFSSYSYKYFSKVSKIK